MNPRAVSGSEFCILQLFNRAGHRIIEYCTNRGRKLSFTPTGGTRKVPGFGVYDFARISPLTLRLASDAFVPACFAFRPDAANVPD